MGMQPGHGYAAWTWTCNVDIQHGHGHAAWNWTLNIAIDMGMDIDMDMNIQKLVDFLTLISTNVEIR
jgi:hypothetical protein